MKIIKREDVDEDKDIMNKAKKFSEFRKDCKEYLEEVGKNYDKFTKVEHDSISGYLSEHAISEYIKNNFNSIQTIELWKDQFNIAKIKDIIKNNDTSITSAKIVKNYFYDRWDMKLYKSNNDIIKADIKTAVTDKKPKDTWDFLYPVVQTKNDEKDIIILIYSIVENDKKIETLDHFKLVGYSTPEIIKQCETSCKGNNTLHGTTSQTNNYKTKINKHWYPLCKKF